MEARGREGREVGHERGGVREDIVRCGGEERGGFGVDLAGGEEERDQGGVEGGIVEWGLGEVMGVDFQTEFGGEAEECGGGGSRRHGLSYVAMVRLRCVGWTAGSLNEI